MPQILRNMPQPSGREQHPIRRQPQLLRDVPQKLAQQRSNPRQLPQMAEPPWLLPRQEWLPRVSLRLIPGYLRLLSR
jgi:hypothetical protein